MNALKLVSIIIFVLASGFSFWLKLLNKRSVRRPIPENVSDVYDGPTYKKWLSYSAEKTRLGMFSEVLTFVVSFMLLTFDLYAWAASLVPPNSYLEAIIVVFFTLPVDLVISICVEYYDNFVIEQKYGFNRTTKKTFWLDQIKELVIHLLLTVGLICLFVLLHQTMGDMVLVLFAAVVFVVIMFIAFLYPVFAKIFNKFTPLEDGELKDRLTAMLEKYGYKVRAIQVMDASKRSTKSNAYFTGFGKMKTIVLYDTLVEKFTSDEIVAVFAHEMGHGLHKDNLKGQILSLVNIVLIVLMLWVNVKFPEICAAFGFTHVNYGFAFILMGAVEMALISPLLGLFTSWRHRKGEYRADAQAVKEGYGEALISALKKLGRENFANLSPSPIVVKLTYDHPTLSERIAAIEKEMNKQIA